jgi:hypothetical protein
MKIRIVSFVLAFVFAGPGISSANSAENNFPSNGTRNGIEEVQSGPRKVAIADGIFLFISPDQDPIEVDGNSIVVVNEHDVLVFDTNVLPSSARAVLAEIRKITDKPVRYVVNSH